MSYEEDTEYTISIYLYICVCVYVCVCLFKYDKQGFGVKFFISFAHSKATENEGFLIIVWNLWWKG